MEQRVNPESSATQEERGFRNMPGAGKAVVLLIWAQTALVALMLYLGLSGSPPEEMQVPDSMGELLLVATTTVVLGGFVFTLSFLLIWGKNWARIVLLLNYSIIGAAAAASMVFQGTSGEEWRNLVLGALAVVLLLNRNVKTWCTGRNPKT